MQKSQSLRTVLFVACELCTCARLSQSKSENDAITCDVTDVGVQSSMLCLIRWPNKPSNEFRFNHSKPKRYLDVNRTYKIERLIFGSPTTTAATINHKKGSWILSKPSVTTHQINMLPTKRNVPVGANLEYRLLQQ
jgi:hypothetical protein